MLPAAAIERLEQARVGGNLMLQVTIEYGLMGGTAAPDWRQPHRPIRGPSDQPTQKIIRAHDWVQNVLEPWQQATAVSLVLPLPQAATTDEYRTIVARLASARHDIDDGQWKPSISATREAFELLRRMRLAVVNTKAQDRTLAEREGAILDRLADFAQAPVRLRLGRQPPGSPVAGYRLEPGERSASAGRCSQRGAGSIRSPVGANATHSGARAVCPTVSRMPDRHSSTRDADSMHGRTGGRDV
jgi:hypothetical protein